LYKFPEIPGDIVKYQEVPRSIPSA